MFVENNREIIDKIYLEYLKEIKPLIAVVEHNYRKFPKGVLKEFRDVFDHIARLYIEDKSPEYYRDNLSKTLNHFDRLKLDVYKYVCDLKKKQINRWTKRYSKYDMSVIDNGGFWEQIIDEFDKCEEIFYQGRDEEHLDIRKACTYYEQYVIKCDSAFKTIKKKKNLISKAVLRHRVFSLKSVVSGIVIGIIASILTSIIWFGAFEPVFKDKSSDSIPASNTTQTIITEKDATIR